MPDTTKQPALTMAEAVRLPALPKILTLRAAALRSVRPSEDAYARRTGAFMQATLASAQAATPRRAKGRAAYNLAARPFACRRVTGVSRSTSE